MVGPSVFGGGPVGHVPAGGYDPAVRVGRRGGIEGDGFVHGDEAGPAGVGDGRVVDPDADGVRPAGRGRAGGVGDGETGLVGSGDGVGVAHGFAVGAGAVAEFPEIVGDGVVGVGGPAPVEPDLAGVDHAVLPRVGHGRMVDPNVEGGLRGVVEGLGVVGHHQPDGVDAGRGVGVPDRFALLPGPVPHLPGVGREGSVGIIGGRRVEFDGGFGGDDFGIVGQGDGGGVDDDLGRLFRRAVGETGVVQFDGLAGRADGRRPQPGDRRGVDVHPVDGLGLSAEAVAGVVLNGQDDPVAPGLVEPVSRFPVPGPAAVVEFPGVAGDPAVGVGGLGTVEEDGFSGNRLGRPLDDRFRRGVDGQDVFHPAAVGREIRGIPDAQDHRLFPRRLEVVDDAAAFPEVSVRKFPLERQVVAVRVPGACGVQQRGITVGQGQRPDVRNGWAVRRRQQHGQKERNGRFGVVRDPQLEIVGKVAVSDDDGAGSAPELGRYGDFSGAGCSIPGGRQIDRFRKKGFEAKR